MRRTLSFLLWVGLWNLASCSPEGLAVPGGTSPGFVTVPGSTFFMGSPADELGRDDDESQRTVTLTRDFEVMASEVTRSRYRQVMGYNPSNTSLREKGPNLPVNRVSWYDSLAFANKLSITSGYAACTVLSDIVCADGSPGDEANACKANGGIGSATVSLNGAQSIYECQGYRLPTEAEWEYMARAGTTTAFPSGEITETSCAPLDPKLSEIAWYCGNAGTKATRPVMKKAPNAWGIYDTAGNVAEWTWDGYASEWPTENKDPLGPVDGYFRVVRGGAVWYHGAARLRSADRAGHTPGYRDRHLGFRLVRTVAKSESGSAVAADLQQAARTLSRSVSDNPASAAESPRAISSEALPLGIVRPDVGDPLTPEEIATFTAKITGFWRDVGYFRWLSRVTHGMDASNPSGMPDYKLYWQDVRAIKASGAVTFEHTGNADNLTIPTPKVLMNAAALYLATGDAGLGDLVEQLCKGMIAGFMGLQWNPQDPELALTARTIFTQDHDYIQDGRETKVEYGPAKHESIDWNAQTIPNPTNPYWGDIWVRNWRSKDDVPHMLRSVPTLLRLAEEAPDQGVKDAAGEAARTLQRFSRDIVDTGYYIRSKDRNGDAYVPLNPNGRVADLASFTEYNFILPNAECDPKLTARVIAYGDSNGLDCGSGFGDLYELFATQSHYYNYDIIRYFHAAAITNALEAGRADIAQPLMEGMVERVDQMMYGKPPHRDDPSWPSDSASFLVVAATGGLPLTSAEARHVKEQYTRAVDHYTTWPNWDLWDPAVPNGEVAWEPDRNDASGPVVEIVEMAYLIDYCNSPWRDDSGAAILDCDVVLDPSRWGE